MSSYFILVVEDDPDGQEVVSRMLRHHNLRYDSAFTGEDALTFLMKNNYDAVIVDLALPGMDGWTLLQKIQANSRTARVPCIAITAFHSAEVAVQAIEAGFQAYFPKPLEATSFVRELESVLGR